MCLVSSEVRIKDMATIKLKYGNELFLVSLGGGGKYLF